MNEIVDNKNTAVITTVFSFTIAALHGHMDGLLLFSLCVYVCECCSWHCLLFYCVKCQEKVLLIYYTKAGLFA